jgi:hypothetical protein
MVLYSRAVTSSPARIKDLPNVEFNLFKRLSTPVNFDGYNVFHVVLSIAISLPPVASLNLVDKARSRGKQ